MKNLRAYIVKRIRTLVNVEKAISNKYITDRSQFEHMMMLLGQLHVQRIKKLKNVNSLEDVEFKVFSQFGVDGILQYIVNKIEIPNKYFVEFGVENYTESNTRFLLMNNKWEGLVIDGSDENINFIKQDRIYYRHRFDAISSFITKENINDLIRSRTELEDIGLLNIDIDGNDYWVWKEIDSVKPRIIICEYNSLFGDRHSISVPYQSDFSVRSAHYSCLFYGASIPALCSLAEEKGYDFIGCDSEGVDAFFVRKDLSHPFNTLTPKEGFVDGKFRISLDEKGRRTYLNRQDSIRLIEDMKVIDVATNKEVILKDLNIK